MGLLIGIVIGVTIVFVVIWYFWLKRQPQINEETIENIKNIINELKQQKQQRIKFMINCDRLVEANNNVVRLLDRGLKKLQAKNFYGAIECFNKALKKAKEKELVSFYNFIGFCYCLASQYSRAQYNYEDAARLAERFNDKEERAIALNNIALIYEDDYVLDKSKYTSAFESGTILWNKLWDTTDDERQQTDLAFTYRTKDELNSCLRDFESKLKIVRESGDVKSEAYYLGNIGLIYGIKWDLDKALKYHTQALELNRKIGNNIGEARELGNIGLTICFLKGFPFKAFQYLESADKLSETLGKKWRLCQIYHLNWRHWTEGRYILNYHKAVDSFSKALGIFKEIGAIKEIEIVEKNINRIKNYKPLNIGVESEMTEKLIFPPYYG